MNSASLLKLIEFLKILLGCLLSLVLLNKLQHVLDFTSTIVLLGVLLVVGGDEVQSGEAAKG